jgi:dephospho-CoA kinase
MIFLTGPHASGKTMVSKIFSTYGFICIELGTTLRAKHKEESQGLDFKDWCQEEEKKYGVNFTDKIIVNKIKEEINKLKNLLIVQDLVIVGSRSYSGIEYIIEKVTPINQRNNAILYLDAPYEILKERYCFREKVEMNDEEFNYLLEKDRQIGIETIASRANYYIWNNESEDKLKKDLELILFSNLNYSQNYKNV